MFVRNKHSRTIPLIFLIEVATLKKKTTSEHTTNHV